MVAESPESFAAAVHAHRLGDLELDPGAVERAGSALRAVGLLMVGEAHGVRETPNALYALARALGTRALAFEWSHEEMDAEVQAFVRGGSFDYQALWRLPPEAELFCGDGRVTAGHFALLERLREEGQLEQVILFDRLDPEPLSLDPREREREMADRLLAEWDDALPLLVAAGASHARLDAGDTMASLLARGRPGLEPVMLDYARGRGWFQGTYDLRAGTPTSAITVRVPVATPAVVPGRVTAPTLVP